MRIVGVIGGAFALILYAAPMQAADTLCAPDEEIFFSCTVENGKQVSVCGSKNLSAVDGYVQYRFGTHSRLELVYPANLSKTQGSFYLHSERSTGIHELYFRSGHYRYIVGRYEPTPITDDPRDYGDVAVTGDAGYKSSTLTCTQTPIGYLGSLVGSVRDINEFPDN